MQDLPLLFQSINTAYRYIAPPGIGQVRSLGLGGMGFMIEVEDDGLGKDRPWPQAPPLEPFPEVAVLLSPTLVVLIKPIYLKYGASIYGDVESYELGPPLFAHQCIEQILPLLQS